MVAWVDQDDYEKVASFKWYAAKTSATFYAARTNSDRRIVYMHRAILGVDDRQTLVDHRNRNGVNNCRYNLRTCTRKQNAQNSRRTHKDKTSRFHGVCWKEQEEHWVAQIGIDYATIRIRIGSYATEEEAARAYDRKAVREFGEFAATNFPRENYGLAQLSRHTGVPDGMGFVDQLSQTPEALKVQDGSRSSELVPLPG